MVAAAEAVFTAMAFERTIREVVEPYQRKILKELGWDIELKSTWTLPDTVFAEFVKRCHEERDKAGLKVDSPEQCPLLVAENLVMEAEHALIEAVQPLTDITLDHLLCSPDGKGLEHLAHYIDLNLRLLAPFVRSADEILKGGKPDGRTRLCKHKDGGLSAGD
jgi:hypothetical protein